jgi:hypothetical protein
MKDSDPYLRILHGVDWLSVRLHRELVKRVSGTGGEYEIWSYDWIMFTEDRLSAGFWAWAELRNQLQCLLVINGRINKNYQQVRTSLASSLASSPSCGSSTGLPSLVM